MLGAEEQGACPARRGKAQGHCRKRDEGRGRRKHDFSSVCWVPAVRAPGLAAGRAHFWGCQVLARPHCPQRLLRRRAQGVSSQEPEEGHLHVSPSGPWEPRIRGAGLGGAWGAWEPSYPTVLLPAPSRPTCASPGSGRPFCLRALCPVSKARFRGQLGSWLPTV